MIKHGSGMAFCLKYVTNKLPSVAQLGIRRSHVSACIGPPAKRPFASPFVQEGHRSSETSEASLSPDSIYHVDVKNHRNIFRLKYDSDVIRYVSYLIFDSDDPHTTHAFQSKDACQCKDGTYAVPYRGTPDDYKLGDICDHKNSSLLHKNRECKESIVHLSDVVQSYAQDASREDLNTSKINSSNNNNNSSSNDASQPPSEEQLAHVHRTLANDLPYFFSKPLNLGIYHPNIVLEDNIRGKRFVGRDNYYIQAKLLYIIGHLRFMYIKLDVLKITSHPDDGTIKVRWKISVLRLRKLYKMRGSFLKALQSSNETWIDGFSTYYVMGDGLVHKHVADKMIPDRDQILKKSEPPVPHVPHPLAYSNRNKL